MRKRNLNFIILLSLCLSLSFCKKEDHPPTQKGILFYPTKFILNSFELSGLTVDNSSLHFTYGSSISGLFNAAGRLNYNADNPSVTKTDINYSDTAKIIRGLTPIDQNKFVAYHVNSTNYFIDSVSKKWIYYLTILMLDENLNTLKEKRLSEGTVQYGKSMVEIDAANIHFRRLSNGNFILCSAEGGLWSKNYLMCFDMDLNIKWKVIIENVGKPEEDYMIKDVLVKNDGIYLLQNKINLNGTFDHYRIKKYDNEGNFVSVSDKSIQGQEGNCFLETKDGYIVTGYSFNAATQRTTFFSEFNLNNSLLSTHFLGPVNYISFYPVKYNSPVISSNILQCNNSYYFMTLECNLVKVNSSFEIEWVRTIDKFVVSAPTFDRYLVNIGDKIICVGQNNWSGVDGITFIKMDFNGNLVN